MNVLTVSIDSSLLDSESAVVRRQNLYAAELNGCLHCIVRVKKPAKMKSHGRVKVYPVMGKFLFPFRAYRIGKDILKKEKISLIVTQDPHVTGLAGYMLKRVSGLPLCVHFHADFLDNKFWMCEKFVNRFFNLLSKFVIRVADGFRVVSSAIAKKLVARGISRSRIKAVSTPIDIGFFLKKNDCAVSSFKKRYDLIEGKYVLFVGRLTAQKNLFFLLDVFKKIENAVLLLAGEGELAAALKAYAEKEGINNARFLGNLNKEELKAAYYFSDCVVLPSMYEGTAKVLKEASACATPCVATDISGTRDVLENKKTGLIVPVNNMNLLYSALRELLDDGEKRKTFGRRAQLKMKGESEKEGVSAVVGFWKKISRV